MNDAQIIQKLQQQIQELQKTIKALEPLTEKIKVIGPNITFETQGTIEFKATNINFKASGILNMNTSGTLNLKGSMIKMNNGNKPAARLGSKTAGTQAMQTVLDGSPTVLIP
ncbi:hypothetical protein GCM10009133_38920 [Cocleimonas flava]|uniref:Uncharacterized protein n=1 Tax=Cocleimonas flava TaxID=634765 RepID=A0A4R1F4J2_9GAMM|nr:hypothetical protein [Cocleimonas flava]TCJ88270.1 hypothetical protein EV695_0110 [Cocleimonas flava]